MTSMPEPRSRSRAGDSDGHHGLHGAGAGARTGHRPSRRHLQLSGLVLYECCPDAARSRERAPATSGCNPHGRSPRPIVRDSNAVPPSVLIELSVAPSRKTVSGGSSRHADIAFALETILTPSGVRGHCAGCTAVCRSRHVLRNRERSDHRVACHVLHRAPSTGDVAISPVDVPQREGSVGAIQPGRQHRRLRGVLGRPAVRCSRRARTVPESRPLDLCAPTSLPSQSAEKCSCCCIRGRTYSGHASERSLVCRWQEALRARFSTESTRQTGRRTDRRSRSFGTSAAFPASSIRSGMCSSPRPLDHSCSPRCQRDANRVHPPSDAAG